jgi:hypothetical protein
MFLWDFFSILRILVFHPGTALNLIPDRQAVDIADGSIAPQPMVLTDVCGEHSICQNPKQ